MRMLGFSYPHLILFHSFFHFLPFSLHFFFAFPFFSPAFFSLTFSFHTSLHFTKSFSFSVTLFFSSVIILFPIFFILSSVGYLNVHELNGHGFNGLGFDKCIWTSPQQLSRYVKIPSSHLVLTLPLRCCKTLGLRQHSHS